MVPTGADMLAAGVTEYGSCTVSHGNPRRTSGRRPQRVTITRSGPACPCGIAATVDFLR
jgi:hypothetical protein